MKVKIKLSDFFAAREFLVKISNLSDLPIYVSYRFAKIIKAVEGEVVSLEEARNKLIRKYGQEDGNGGYTIPIENVEAIENFNKEFGELLSKDIELEIPTVNLDDLNGVKLSPNDVRALYFIITEMAEEYAVENG